jgi:hypothetical protein
MCAVVSLRYRHDVKSASPILEAWVAHQKNACGPCEFALLVVGDALTAVSEMLVVAHTYLHEDQQLAVLHNEIQFAQPAPIVAGDEFEPSIFQVLTRGGFRPGT